MSVARVAPAVGAHSRDLHGADEFAYRHLTDGTVLYYGLRSAPDGSEDVLFVANMEDQPTTVTPIDLVDPTRGGWRTGLAKPDLEAPVADGPVALGDSDVIVFTRHH